MILWRCTRCDCWEAKTYLVVAESAEGAAVIAQRTWGAGEQFKAEEFFPMGNAYLHTTQAS